MGAKKQIKKQPLSVIPFFVAAILLVTTVVILRSSDNKQEIRTQAAGINSQLCGTNLGLFNTSDSFLTSTTVQNNVKTMHITLIRMPIRNFTPNAIETQAAQIIKKLGLTPIVTLSLSAPDPVAAGKTTIQAMNGIFGSSLVYYELGNEQFDSAYTGKWNQIISQLQSLPTNGKFIGPVAAENFGPTETANMASFWHTANPKPYALSWHEYSCGSTDNAQFCLDHIDTTPGHNWGQHMTDTTSKIQANGDSVPPIFITEWNYDANPPASDPRLTATFQQQFVQRALNQLAKEGVSGATQYVLNTNPNYNLVDSSGNLTPAGQAFAQICAGASGNTTPATSTMPGITATTAPTSMFVTPTVFCIGKGVCTTPAISSPMTSGSPQASIPVSLTPSGASSAPTIALSGIPSQPHTHHGHNKGLIHSLLALLLQIIQLILQLLQRLLK